MFTLARRPNAPPRSLAANRAMAAALGDAGYHYRFIYAEGAGHCDGGVIGQTLPETLEWLWRGYPIATP